MMCDKSKRKITMIKSVKKVITRPYSKPVIVRVMNHVPYEKILYQSTESSDDYLGEVRKLVIKNCWNNVQRPFITKAVYYNSNGDRVEKTSRNITNLLGFKNYQIILNIADQVSDEKLKIKAILSLLTTEFDVKDKSTQTVVENKDAEVNVDLTYSNSMKGIERKDAETQVNFLTNTIRTAQKKIRIRRPVLPHVFKTPDDALPNIKTEKTLDSNIKIVDTDLNLNTDLNSEPESTQITKDTNTSTEQLLFMNEDSNISSMSISSEILKGAEQILTCTEKNTKLDSFLQNGGLDTSLNDVFTEKTFCKIHLWDGTYVTVQNKPHDIFHLTDPEILKELTKQERMKLMLHQTYLDWKYCMESNMEGYCLIHLAVIHKELDMLKRQCLALNKRKVSVNIEANGVTALEMAIQNRCPTGYITLLVDSGADVHRKDGKQKTPLHHAAEAGGTQMEELICAIEKNARRILQEVSDGPVVSLTDAECAEQLFTEFAFNHERQGYTPLMLACKLGHHDVATLLLSRSPTSVNHAMTNSGNTALYIAVSVAGETAQKTGVIDEKYLKTIEVLIQHGADPCISNNSGSTVNSLLLAFDNLQLCGTISNLMSSKYGHGEAKMLIHVDGKTMPLPENGKEKNKMADGSKKIEKRTANVPSSDSNVKKRKT